MRNLSFLSMLCLSTVFAQQKDTTIAHTKYVKVEKLTDIKFKDYSFYLDDQSETLLAIRNGKTEWKINIIQNCGKSYLGKLAIRSITLLNGKLEIVFGKHSFAEINISNGELKCRGSD